MSESHEWTSIGRTADGGAVYAAPASTQPADLDWLEMLVIPPNPFFPAPPCPLGPLPEPPRRSILRDAIEAVAAITRPGRW